MLHVVHSAVSDAHRLCCCRRETRDNVVARMAFDLRVQTSQAVPWLRMSMGRSFEFLAGVAYPQFQVLPIPVLRWAMMSVESLQLQPRAHSESIPKNNRKPWLVC